MATMYVVGLHTPLGFPRYQERLRDPKENKIKKLQFYLKSTKARTETGFPLVLEMIFQAPRLYIFYILNSAEHEIFAANKFENANISWHFHFY